MARVDWCKTEMDQSAICLKNLQSNKITQDVPYKIDRRLVSLIFRSYGEQSRTRISVGEKILEISTAKSFTSFGGLTDPSQRNGQRSQDAVPPNTTPVNTLDKMASASMTMAAAPAARTTRLVSARRAFSAGVVDVGEKTNSIGSPDCAMAGGFPRRICRAARGPDVDSSEIAGPMSWRAPVIDDSPRFARVPAPGAPGRGVSNPDNICSAIRSSSNRDVSTRFARFGNARRGDARDSVSTRNSPIDSERGVPGSPRDPIRVVRRRGDARRRSAGDTSVRVSGVPTRTVFGNRLLSILPSRLHALD